MPHSVSSQPTSPVPQQQPDAVAVDDMAIDETETPPPSALDDLVTAKKEDAEDVAMTDVPVARASAPALYELFDDDNDDDEFPSTLPAEDAAPVDLLSIPASDSGVMRSFYQRLFPWRYLFQWLNHSPTPTTDFAHREFAFTLQNESYLRYQSFPTADLLRKDVLRLMPTRFEIGPVYSTNPRERKTLAGAAGTAHAFRPVSKELCFDIDLTDYDSIRTCCTKTNICGRCWQFITMAIAVIDTALREDFGFRHILWVYSGRRGAHAWVCDRRARLLDDAHRRSIAGYLELLRGGSQSGKKVSLRRPLHPHVARSLSLLRTHFQEDVLEQQNPWAAAAVPTEDDTEAEDDVDALDKARSEKLLALLPDKNLAEALRRRWAASPGRSSTAKWADIDTVAKTGTVKGLDLRALLEAKQDIVLEYTYPRLDIEVSRKLNHLLKSPFVVHPGTGRVCVPIDPQNLDTFDPLDVPTVQSLLQEIDTWKQPEAAEEDTKPLQDWEKTRLRPYIEHFRTFVLALIRDETADMRIKHERDEAGGMEF